jgi:hypothetical protein
MKFGAMDPNMKLVLEEMAKLRIEMECFAVQEASFSKRLDAVAVDEQLWDTRHQPGGGDHRLRQDIHQVEIRGGFFHHHHLVGAIQAQQLLRPRCEGLGIIFSEHAAD